MKSKYSILLKEIRHLADEARHIITRHINTGLLHTYWHAGRLITEKEKEEKYDETALRQMLPDVSKELSHHLGKGFSRSNLFYMRRFFLVFASGVQTVSEQRKLKSVQTVSERKKINAQVVISQMDLTVSNLLSWSHYCELLKCNDELETGFYLNTKAGNKKIHS